MYWVLIKYTQIRHLRFHYGRVGMEFVSQEFQDGNLVLMTQAKFPQNDNNREVLQTEFRFRFRKGPRQISAGPG